MSPAAAVYINDLIRDNPEVRSIFEVMNRLGLPVEESLDELCCAAFLGCIWEMEKGCRIGGWRFLSDCADCRTVSGVPGEQSETPQGLDTKQRTHSAAKITEAVFP